LREVLILLLLEFSGYQLQEVTKHPQQYFSLLESTQMFLKEVKASSKRDLKLLHLTFEVIDFMGSKDYNRTI
jgi:hypothetical protein